MTHTKLVFLRHGRTEWNELGKLQGQADVELDEVGEKQAEEAARFFADWDFEACYTSDLKRALRTAHMVAEPHGLDVVPDARLREINVGSWSGMTTAESVPWTGPASTSSSFLFDQHRSVANYPNVL